MFSNFCLLTKTSVGLRAEAPFPLHVPLGFPNFLSPGCLKLHKMLFLAGPNIALFDMKTYYFNDFPQPRKNVYVLTNYITYLMQVVCLITHHAKRFSILQAILLHFLISTQIQALLTPSKPLPVSKSHLEASAAISNSKRASSLS